jgi:hypothetical protein
MGYIVDDGDDLVISADDVELDEAGQLDPLGRDTLEVEPQTAEIEPAAVDEGPRVLEAAPGDDGVWAVGDDH